jgi:hypothetical protein
MADEAGGEGLQYWLDQLLELGRRLIVLPGRLDSALGRLERGDISVQTRSSPAEARRLDRLNAAINRLAAVVAFAALLIAATQLYLNGERALGTAGFAAAGLVLLWLLAGLRG